MEANNAKEGKYKHGEYVLCHTDDGYAIGLITDVIKTWRPSGICIFDYFLKGCYIDKSQYNAYKNITYTPIKKICVIEENILSTVPKEAIEALYDITIQEGKLL